MVSYFQKNINHQFFKMSFNHLKRELGLVFYKNNNIFKIINFNFNYINFLK